MAEEIAFENVWIFNFEGLLTLTLTLDQVVLHTIVHHLSTSTKRQISLKWTKLFVDSVEEWTKKYRSQLGMHQNTPFQVKTSFLNSPGGEGYSSPHLTPHPHQAFWIRPYVPQNSSQIITPLPV